MASLTDDDKSPTAPTLTLEAERAVLIAEQRILLQERAILRRLPA
jgi:hypothetical protein